MKNLIKNVFGKPKTPKATQLKQQGEQLHIDPYNKLFLLDVEDQMSNFGEEIKFENIASYIAEDYSSHFFFIFDIDVCPDWKFGVGWNCKQFEEGFIEYKFFANNKNITTKFSPATTSLVESGRYFIGNNKKNIVYNVCEMIHYIHSEKELAFCQELKLYNYNRMYFSREEACEVYKNAMESISKEDAYIEEEVEFDKKILGEVCKYKMTARLGEKYAYDLLIVEDEKNIGYCTENINSLIDYLKYKLPEEKFAAINKRISDEEDRRRDEQYDNGVFVSSSPIYKIKFVVEV